MCARDKNKEQVRLLQSLIWQLPIAVYTHATRVTNHRGVVNLLILVLRLLFTTIPTTILLQGLVNGYCAYTQHITLYMYVHGSRHAIPSLSKTLIHVTQACLNRFRPLLQSTQPLNIHLCCSLSCFPPTAQ